MKIAVTSKGKDLTSEVDPRFGRAANILIVDPDTFQFEVLDNQDNANAFQGSGIQAASRICREGVDVLLTGYCGPKAFQVLQAGNVKVVQNVTGPIRDALRNFKDGNYSFASSANADAHW